MCILCNHGDVALSTTVAQLQNAQQYQYTHVTPRYLTNVKHSPLDRSCDLSYSILFYSRLCPSTAIKALYQSPPSFSVLHYPCPYHSLLPHNVTSPFLCPLLSLSIPLPVAPQCHLSDLSLSLSFAILVHTAPCRPTMSPLPFSVLHYPCPYGSLSPHSVFSPGMFWSSD